MMGHLMEEESVAEFSVGGGGGGGVGGGSGSNGSSSVFPATEGPGGAGGGKMAKVMVDTFLPREEDVIRYVVVVTVVMGNLKIEKKLK